MHTETQVACRILALKRLRNGSLGRVVIGCSIFQVRVLARPLLRYIISAEWRNGRRTCFENKHQTKHKSKAPNGVVKDRKAA